MVQHITYKNEKYPFKVGYYALKMLKQDTGKSLESLGQDDLEVYESLLFHSLKQGHTLENKEFKFTKEDMEQVLDECFFEFVELIPTFFPDPNSLPGMAVTPAKKKK